MICRLSENLQHVIKYSYHPVIIGDLDQDLGSHIELGSRAFFVPSQCLDEIWDTFFVPIDNRDRIKIAKSQLSPILLPTLVLFTIKPTDEKNRSSRKWRVHY